MKSTTIRLLAGVAGIAVSTIAHAQTPAAAPGAAEAETEIIVTAQKRAERLLDVPLTISVVTGEALKRQSISNIQDLQNATPELNFIGQPSSGYSIRGSGTQTFSRSAENNVLVVVDGVVLGQLTPPTTSLFDLAQVEVLSGPQGMLFGKNASAGVVAITTNKPDPSKPEFLFRLSAGERDYLVVNAMANVPLGQNAALRVTGSTDRMNGVTFNRFTSFTIDDFNNAAVRGRLLWDATPALTFNLIADYENQRGGNNAWTARSAPNTGPTSIGGRLAACGVTPSETNTEVCLDGPTTRAISGGGVSFQVDLDIGAAALTSITAWRKYNRDANTDSDTRPINALNLNRATDDIRQVTEELRIASTGEQRLNYVAGLFFYDYRYKSLNEQAGTLGLLPFVTARSFTDDVVQRSFAAFGQASLNVTDQFTLIAGARQTWDKVSLANGAFVNPALGIRFAPAFSPAVDATISNRISTNNFSYRVGAQFRPSRDMTFFATYSRGYKGPALNNLLAGSAAPLVVRPEIPTNIEAGVKTAFMRGRLRFDLSAFDTRSKDFQAQTAVVVGTTTQFVFANASELHFRGAQFNANLNPLDGLNLNLGVLYNKATYGDFIVQCNAPYTISCTTAGGSTTINARGRQLAGAPLWKVTAGFGYATPMSDTLTGFIDANAVYRSRQNTSATPDPNLVVPPYTLVDARVGLRAPDSRWSVAVFAKNLFDKRAAGFIFRDPLSPTNNYMQSFASNAFRTIGGTVEFRF